MRIVFCGSGSFGIPTLRALGPGGHDVAAVITQPPRRAGRGSTVRPTPLAEAAGGLGLPVRAAEDINAPEHVAAIAALAPEAMVVVDFGQKILAPARQVARLGAINLHGSLLPELRGAAPVNWAIVRGHRTTGVTTFSLVDRMDAGPVFATRSTPIRPDETADELEGRLAELGAAAVLETLELLAQGAKGQDQDESQATLAPKLKKPDGVIDWSVPAETIHNLIHGTWPWPAGQSHYVSADGKAADVLIARAAARALPVQAEPGAILDDLTVATGQGRLGILQIKPAGRKLMAWRDFVNGYRAGAGARFTVSQ